MLDVGSSRRRVEDCLRIRGSGWREPAELASVDVTGEATLRSLGSTDDTEETERMDSGRDCVVLERAERMAANLAELESARSIGSDCVRLRRMLPRSERSC